MGGDRQAPNPFILQMQETHVSNLKKWGKLYEFYKATHRTSIVKSLFKGKPLSDSWPYWAALAIYLAVSLLAYFIVKTYWLSMLSIYATAFAIYIWLEFKIAKAFHIKYENNNLKSHTFFLRSKYLSYLLFVDKLNNDIDFAKVEVASLVKWENIRQEQINSFDFFKTPGVLLIVPAILSLFIEYLKSKNLVNTKYIFIILLFIFVLLWFGWIVSDTLKSHKKKTLEICRFLKWWKLEK